MRLVTLAAGDHECAGVVIEGRVLLLEAASGGRLADPRPGKTALPLKAILPDPELMQDVRDVAARGEQDPSFLDRFAIPLREQDLHAPIPRPGKVLCLGLNYRDHAAESGAEVPDEPVIFSKAPSSVIGPGDPIRLPETSDQVDYEVELAFVIGAPARNVHASQAMYHVAGYTVLNDVTARDYQHVRGGGQWTLAKSFDTFCPIGPWIVTPDEVPDPHDLTLECRIGGEVLQSGSTSEMIFKIPQIIEYLSAVLTLEPGDVVGTGTPPGVGFARTPQRFLQAGDLLECTVQSIGTLVNPVRA